MFPHHAEPKSRVVCMQLRRCFYWSTPEGFGPKQQLVRKRLFFHTSPVAFEQCSTKISCLSSSPSTNDVCVSSSLVENATQPLRRSITSPLVAKQRLSDWFVEHRPDPYPTRARRTRENAAHDATELHSNHGPVLDVARRPNKTSSQQQLFL